MKHNHRPPSLWVEIKTITCEISTWKQHIAGLLRGRFLPTAVTLSVFPCYRQTDVECNVDVANSLCEATTKHSAFGISHGLLSACATTAVCCIPKLRCTKSAWVLVGWRDEQVRGAGCGGRGSLRGGAEVPQQGQRLRRGRQKV